MRTKTILALFLALVLMLLAAPAYALGLGISPAEVEVDVPADGSTEINFKVYKFIGDISVELESIPLSVEPQIISVVTEDGGFPVTLTIHGDSSLGNQTYRGYIKFLGIGEGNVGLQIKVVATVNHIAEQKIVPTPEEPPPGQVPLVKEPPLPEQAPQAGFPIIPVAGVIGGAILISIIVLVRMRQ